MIRIRELFLGILWLIISVNLYAQNTIPDFGDIPQEHIEIRSFRGDSSLGAIVLFDKGEVSFDSNLNVVLDRHVRIKILSEKGYDWADVTIPYYASGQRQSLDRLKAVSYNIGADGEIRSNKVRRRDFFDEEISDKWEQVKFTFPAVEPGTIVEYRYQIESESLADFPDWTFQRDIPTLVSSYKANVPEWYRYVFYFQGAEQLDKKTSDSYPDAKILSFNRDSAFRTRNVRVSFNATEYVWEMRDIPALKEEPYMSSTKNYRSKLFVQLASIQYPNSMLEPVLNDWGTVAEELRKHDNFGKKLKVSRQMKETVARIVSNAETDLEKMRLVYDYIAKNIKWNEELGFLVDRSMDEVLTQKTGNGAEVNLLLVQMLREAELEANPVLLSTRDNGRLLTIYPIMVQFNHVICEVALGDGEDKYYLDAKSDLRPYNLLPVADLNGDALVVTENGYRWTNLVETAPSNETYYINARMSEEAVLSGTWQAVISGYPALNARASFEENGDQDESDIIKELWLDGYTDVRVDSLDIVNKKDFEQPLKISSLITVADAFQSSNEEFYYFNPMVVLREESNPFRQEERKFPVVFPSTFRKKMVLSLFLPSNLEVEELPESKLGRLQNNAGSFRRIFQKAGGKSITILYEIRFDRHIFEPVEYEYLKNFWEDLVASHSELIVLKREDSDEVQK